MRSLLMFLALVAACAETPRYSYRPTDAATATATTSDGGVPSGAVQVSVVGVPRGGLVHVRMVVHNADGEVWELEALDQHALVDGRGNLIPRYTRCDGVEMSTVVLMPGDTRTFDLYYALPSHVGTTPPVYIDWRVRTPARVVARRTTAFAPHELPPPPKVAPMKLDPRTLAGEVPRRDRGDIDGGGR
jgi:hypothetical protein